MLKTNPWHREEEQHNNHETPGRQTKRSNQLSLPNQDDCKTRMDIKERTKNIEQLQTLTMGVSINNKVIRLQRSGIDTIKYHT